MAEKIQFTMEFEIKSSPRLLFQYLSTPSGMGEWFAENVDSRSEVFIFSWNGSEERATLLKKKKDKLVRFKWEEDKNTEYYFEFCIQVDEVTNDLALIITDFALEDEIEEAKMYWRNSISELKQVIGS